MKNIAVLSTMYYPDMGAPSAVIEKYLNNLDGEYNFYIITKTYKQKEEIKERDDVRYITGCRHSTIMWCENNINKRRLLLISKLILLFINIYKLFATQFCNPTANAWENKAYYNELKKLHSEVGIDCVISVSNTFFCQFAARKLKKEHPAVKWLTFVTDPFSKNYIYYRYKLLSSYWRKRNRKTEKEVYESADHNLMCEDMYRFALKDLNVSKDKLTCFRFVLNDKYSNYVSDGQEDCKDIKLIYAGAVYKDIRNPLFMLQVMASLKDLKLDLFINSGECEDILAKYVGGNITRQGFAPKEKYDHMICCEYDILVNIGNISTIQTPSKTLDLISTGKPIINFSFVKDAQYQMIEQYPLGLNILDEEDGAAQKILDFCKSNKGKRMSFEDVQNLYPENSLQKQTEKFREILQS